MKTRRKRNSSKGKGRRNRRTHKTRKSFKGGFLSEASYYANKIDSFFSVDPTPPFGNTSISVPFF